MSDPTAPKPSKKPIEVHDETVTPITQQEIHKVEATQWADKPMSMLHNELSTLRERQNSMLMMGKPNIAKQIGYGIQTLEAVIQARYNKTGN